MESHNSLDRSDRWIVSVTALCALLLFSWLIYDIAFLNPLLQGPVEIGKIYEAKNRVKRKFNRSLIWYAAQNDETVYENDWIFTGSQSIAKIRLNSGGEIVVEPDSLIILSRKNGVIQLNLQHGRLLADVKTGDVKINIVRGDIVETVDTSKGIVSVAQEEDLPLDTQIEEVQLQENESLSDFANKKYFEPEPGYTELDENGFSFKKNNDGNFKLYKGQKANMNLEWKDPYGRWKSYEVQVSEDPQFTNTLTQSQLEKVGFDFKTAEQGRYHWRVRGFDENGQPGDWSTHQNSNISIQMLDKAKAVALSREKFLYQLNNEDLNKVKPDRSYDINEEKKISIGWKKIPQATNYRVQISDKDDFSNVLAEKIIAENELDIKNVKLGNTFFRVIPESEDGIAVAEEARGKVTTYFPAPNMKSLKTIPKKDYQVLQWDVVPYAEAYEVKFKTKRDGEEKTQIVKDNKAFVNSEEGFLQWKVRVVDANSKQSMGSFSETVDWYDEAKRLASVSTGQGQVASSLPKITKPEPRKTYISVDQSPLFIVMNWTYPEEAKGYFVEIAKNPKMEKPVYRRKVKKKRAVINQKFDPGVYYMRVRATKEDITQEAWSEVEVFRVINRRSN